MRQFDLYRNPSERAAAYAPYLIVLQSHFVERVDSVVIAPLIRDANRPLSLLDIPALVAGETLIIAVAEMAAMDRSLLRRAIGDASEHEDAIRRALDRLFTGF